MAGRQAKGLDGMKVTGAEFREAKTGPNKGMRSVLVKGTKRTAFVTVDEMRGFNA